MAWLGLDRLFPGNRRRRSAELWGQVAAIHRSQAVAEFDLQGRVLAANQNFLDAMGYRWDEVDGRHHSLFVDAAERPPDAYRDSWGRPGAGPHEAGRSPRLAPGRRAAWPPACSPPLRRGHRPPPTR